MKSLSVKIPIKIAEHMDNEGRLNPQWIKDFIFTNMDKAIEDKPANGLTYNYTFKVDNHLHKAIKITAIEYDLPINELICRLLDQYYGK